jgi:hypothetical protein
VIAAELLDQLRAEGVEVHLDGDRVRLRADHQPPSTLVAAVREHRDALCALLRVEQPATIVIQVRPICRDADHALHVLHERGVAVRVEREPDGTRWLDLHGGDLDLELINAVGDVRSEVVRLLTTQEN